MSGPDPFRHHPDLRDHLRDPATSRYRTFDPASLDERMRAMGAPAGWRLSSKSREAARKRVLAAHEGGDLWLFGFGSLMWDPGVHFTEVRRARLEGYRREFCIHATIGRGSDEAPGLMAAMVPGGSCEGLAFRIAEETVETETEMIWRREMMAPVYLPVFLPAQTAAGPVTVLAFVIDEQSPSYLCNLSEDAAARRIAVAEGPMGTNFEYLDALQQQLERMGIDDPHISALHARAVTLRGGSDT